MPAPLAGRYQSNKHTHNWRYYGELCDRIKGPSSQVSHPIPLNVQEAQRPHSSCRHRTLSCGTKHHDKMPTEQHPDDDRPERLGHIPSAAVQTARQGADSGLTASMGSTYRSCCMSIGPMTWVDTARAASRHLFGMVPGTLTESRWSRMIATYACV